MQTYAGNACGLARPHPPQQHYTLAVSYPKAKASGQCKADLIPARARLTLELVHHSAEEEDAEQRVLIVLRELLGRAWHLVQQQWPEQCQPRLVL